MWIVSVYFFCWTLDASYHILTPPEKVPRNSWASASYGCFDLLDCFHEEVMECKRRPVLNFMSLLCVFLRLGFQDRSPELNKLKTPRRIAPGGVFVCTYFFTYFYTNLEKSATVWFLLLLCLCEKNWFILCVFIVKCQSFTFLCVDCKMFWLYL